MSFLDGATSLDSFLKAYETNEIKSILPYEWLGSPDKHQRFDPRKTRSFLRMIFPPAC